MMSFIKFETKITPMIIKVVYLLGTFYYLYKSVIASKWWQALEHLEFNTIMLGLLMWVIGLIAIRLVCEFQLVLFNALSKIASR